MKCFKQCTTHSLFVKLMTRLNRIDISNEFSQKGRIYKIINVAFYIFLYIPKV